MERYRARLEEHYIPEVVRVYCANPRCAKWHHPRTFNDSDQRWTVVACECGTTTCVGCKAEKLSQHVCEKVDSSKRPEWLPEYSAECRVKQCPKCAEWIQLSEACNHMECSSCHHQFCVVCLLPWTGSHGNEDVEDSWGCPTYGDPACGYDDDGFEKPPRGLHFYTGRDGLGQPRQRRENTLRQALNELDQATTEIIATLTASAERIEAEALQSDQARGEAGQHEELVQTLRERLSALEREFNDGVPPALEPFVFVVDEDRDEVAVQQLRDQLQQLQQRLAPVPDDEPDEEEQLGFVVDEDEDENEVEQLRAQGLQQRLGLVPNAGEGSSDSDDDLNDAQQLNEEEGFVVEDHFDDPELRRLPRLVTVPGDDGESSDSD